MGRKAFKISEQENNWRGFLYDLDCKNSATVREHFLPGEITSEATDPETVTEARDGSQTVVTSNGGDFVRYIVERQRRDDNESCEDCWGLVIVPNKELDREFALRKANIKAGIRIAGEQLPWKAAAYANLCVAIERTGTVKITKFERCLFCEKASPLLDQQWYKNLPVAHAARRPGSKKQK